ncbi:MAG: phosphodiester glycosidase family protein [Oscillospiraceae bacterium]|nr:phosphodiester glycosidase family protein [Oscillospiraceae bacterium]
MNRKRAPRKGRVVRIVRRCALVFVTVLALVVAAVFALCNAVFNGPSVTARNQAVLSLYQASATKWVPRMFLPDVTVNQIIADSETVQEEVVSLENNESLTVALTGSAVPTDEWADAKDGLQFRIIKGTTFKAYILIVKDPKRVHVGVSSENFGNSSVGITIFSAAQKYNFTAAINGGEFPDNGGHGNGNRPVGLTYSFGKKVWDDGLTRSFCGFDKDDRLVVSESMTRERAERLGIRDSVCFQNGNALMSSENGQMKLYRADSNLGTAQRTAIGQRADGAVILLVTDGRSASSLGATHNDVLNIMLELGVINALKLDGGSSTMMYYKDWFDKYGQDKSQLDSYQLKGLVNKYKAFTSIRTIPTFFVVSPE